MDIELKKSLRNCESSESLLGLLQSVDAEELSAGEVDFIHYVIEKVKPAYDE